MADFQLLPDMYKQQLSHARPLAFRQGSLIENDMTSKLFFLILVRSP